MAAQALASAAFAEGKYAVAFPFFGAERRGAPVLAFTRVDDKKIRIKTQVYEPDYAVVLDDSLCDQVNVLAGLKDGGILIVNTQKKPDDLNLEKCVKTATVDATSIALEVLGSAVTNSAILGAFAKATGKVTIDGVEKGIMDIFGARIGEKNAKKNADAARKSYEKTVMGQCKGGRQFHAKKQWLPNYKELPLGLSTKPMKTDAGLVGPGAFIENKTGSWRTFKPEKDDSKCNKCLFCWFYCPEGCITRKGDTLTIQYDYCKGCGICAHECPKEAIKMVR
jgi:2-oxoacid:acceptor oxidoreductase gamma subunit (pyruvate/2-ketoisovalerate family)/2-oxoacid:acceptor oxidoreductase delta subunit (pyruvate/2-ketoisovalerate family)